MSVKIGRIKFWDSTHRPGGTTWLVQWTNAGVYCDRPGIADTREEAIAAALFCTWQAQLEPPAVAPNF